MSDLGNMRGYNKYNDRRKGPDALVRWVKWASGIAWVMFIFAICLILQAKPEVENMFYQMFNIQLRTTWDSDLMFYNFILMIVLFIFCLVSILFNHLRRRRKTDRIHKSLIFLSVLSFLGILISLYMFI